MCPWLGILGTISRAGAGERAGQQNTSIFSFLFPILRDSKQFEALPTVLPPSLGGINTMVEGGLEKSQLVFPTVWCPLDHQWAVRSQASPQPLWPRLLSCKHSTVVTHNFWKDNFLATQRYTPGCIIKCLGLCRTVTHKICFESSKKIKRQIMLILIHPRNGCLVRIQD